MQRADWSGIREQSAKVNSENSYEYEQSELPEFRKFSRREIYKALGVASADGVKKLIDKVSEHILDTTGEFVEFGEKDDFSGKYTYRLDEIYRILDTIPEMSSLRATKNKISKAFRAPRDQGAYVMTIANQKGGVGKTTFTIQTALGQALMRFERPRILVIDFDPQGSLHAYFDGREISIKTTPTVAKYLQQDRYSDVVNFNSTKEEKRDFILNNIVRKSSVPNVDYCPAFSEDMELLTLLDRLEQSFEDGKYHGTEAYSVFREEVIEPIKHDYDLIIIDTAPQSTIYTKVSLFAADHLVVPAPTRRMDFDSTKDFIDQTAEWVTEVLYPEMDYEGKGLKYFDVVKTMHNHSQNAHSDMNVLYNSAYPHNTYTIPLSALAIYNTLSQEHECIYTHSSNSAEGWKTAKAEWDRLNDHFRRTISQEWSEANEF
ncbi:ParA family protein [Vibrio owensii]|uniref:ParA family protein n=1 Tax=Vibrio harveyi group TaxID=717610 RepID=UPI003CC62A29